MFDLNTSVFNWRQTLAATGTLGDSDLDELEDHLRQQMADLEAHNLSPEEAFLIAARRLGNPEDLGGEFSIADPGRRRNFRLRWMITGALAMIMLRLSAGILANISTGAMGLFPGFAATNPTNLGWVSGVIKMGSLVLGGWLIWHLSATDRSSRRLKKMNGAAVIVGSILLAFFALMGRTTAQMFVSRALSSDDYMEVALVNAWFDQAMLLLLPAVLLAGLWRVVQTRPPHDGLRHRR